jgi:hypothetical protein
MLTCVLVNSELDQAIVLATSEEAPPSIAPQGVKFLSLAEGINRELHYAGGAKGYIDYEIATASSSAQGR